ncbi:angiopoietin-related protein 7-like [Argopecten irradians]|uniref:angiopoietin-related protein 7-like n=1 Tax=Argopecten irradians TaxID=31199 RepID=UPI0037163015
MFVVLLVSLYVVSPVLSVTSFARILRASPVNVIDGILSTYNNKTYVDCARNCHSDCLSFTYEPVARECKTFSKRFCRNDTAEVFPINMLFVKVERQATPANPLDCSDMDPDLFCSGVYRITPTPGASFNAYCDMDTANGPWTVIQNRQNGDEEFYRSWHDYKNGFGDLLGNFWLGNKAIHHLTKADSVLRIEVVSWFGDARYAEYSTFQVANQANNYRLNISGFSGDVRTDGMAYHNGMQFSTYDQDNDNHGSTNCAQQYRGGWWYNACYDANLNGRVYVNGSNNFQSMVWDNFYENIAYPHMMKTKMLVKRSLVT